MEIVAAGGGSEQIVGVDVGGTFTDLVWCDGAMGQMRFSKVASTLDNQAFGMLNALDEVGAPLADIALIVHGTTPTTNAVLAAGGAFEPDHL